ncbi:hypothetical protein B5C34_00865 [Pacificimonas flava]|uniref:histidine kinase n=2 Tax=Pacificimonas TaxID=1960290 RepID=A0A219B1E3_9SPHN|nr:hypothetical protein B5C34_00865 [Pacificimonas flava]
MGEIMRAHDWASTPFGPLESWPQSLRSALSICLNSAFPVAIYWGEELRLLYNDAWSVIPGPRHPSALGKPAKEVWSDIWHIIEPQLGQVLDGEGFATFDQLLPMQRYGFAEETFWNYSFTPIRGEDGSVVGVFNSGSETTNKVQEERRLSLLFQLVDRLGQEMSAEGIVEGAAEVLSEPMPGVSVALAHQKDGGYEILGPGEPALPRRLALQRARTMDEKLLETLRAGRTVVYDERHLDALGERGTAKMREKNIAALLAAPILQNREFVAAFFVTAREPRIWSDADIRLVAEIAERVWNAIELANARTRLRESDARFEMAVNASAIVGTWNWDLVNDLIFTDERFAELYSVEPAAAREGLSLDNFLGSLHPDDSGWVKERIEQAIERRGEFSAEYRLQQKDGTVRWVLAEGRCETNDTGRPVRFPGVSVDLTDRKNAEEKQALLVRELHHRVKNNLATVQSIIRYALRTSSTIDELQESVSARIAALSRTHDLLARGEWTTVSVETIFRTETEAYDDGLRVRLSGPDIELDADRAAALSTAVHELTTNALKHGALSSDKGNVEVDWHVHPD